jgi:hypothetical protein
LGSISINSSAKPPANSEIHSLTIAEGIVVHTGAMSFAVHPGTHISITVGKVIYTLAVYLIVLETALEAIAVGK